MLSERAETKQNKMTYSMLCKSIGKTCTTEFFVTCWKNISCNIETGIKTAKIKQKRADKSYFLCHPFFLKLSCSPSFCFF